MVQIRPIAFVPEERLVIKITNHGMSTGALTDALGAPRAEVMIGGANRDQGLVLSGMLFKLMPTSQCHLLYYAGP